MTPRFMIRRDTQAWRTQVWIAFGLSALMTLHGVWNLPGENLDRILVALGAFFCLSAAFTLAKTIRDNQHEKVDTPAWTIQVWSAFAIAITLTGWALFRLKIDPWHQAYLIASSLFMLSSAFTLAKTVRDDHEANILDAAQKARLQQAMPAPQPVSQPATKN
jgi:hypothetical protein